MFVPLMGLLLIPLLPAQDGVHADAAPVVATQEGSVRGQIDAEGNAVFQGIPYAAPPVGALRWRAPQPHAAWSSVRDATTPPPSCMQVDWGWNTRDAHADSEDCLYLNLATPALHPAHPLPVIVWIHGGANYNGSGRYSAGQTLTRHGVVLVSINYRLGIFGFLAHPALTAESPHHSSGNYALLDQIAALRWVHNNIAHFGGDPANVTIAGQSAGAIDVGMLLTSPVSQGLFAKAIDESGGPISPIPILPDLRDGEKLGQSLAAFAGAPAGPRQIEALRSMTAQQLLDATQRYTAPDAEGVPTRLGPALIVDGWALPLQPAAALRDAKAQRIPLLIGSNIQEFTFSGSSVIRPNRPPDPPAAVRKAIADEYGEEAAAATADYGLSPSDTPPVDPLLGSVGTQLRTDTFFRCPARIAGDWLSRSGVAIWEYQFERPLPGTGSASTRHSGELPYVFGSAQKPGPGAMGASFAPSDAALSEQMQSYWTNFAKTGNPNSAGLPFWPQYREPSPVLMRFPATATATTGPAARGVCRLLELHLDHTLSGRQPSAH